MPSDALPPGWTLEHSRTHGRSYYYHAESDRVTWDLPSLPSHSMRQNRQTSTTSASSPSQVSVSVDSDGSVSSTKSFKRTGEASEDLSSTGKISLDGEGGVSSTKSPDSAPRTSSSNSGEGGSTKSPESADRTGSERSFNSAAESLVVDDGPVIGVPVRVLQLVEEFMRYKNAASRIDELKVLISGMELERWALEAALEDEEEGRPDLEKQLACLQSKYLEKTTELKDAQRNLAESEATLVKVVEAKRGPAVSTSSPGSLSSRSNLSSGSSRSSKSKASRGKVSFSDEPVDAKRLASARLEAQALTAEFFRLQGQLSSLDDQLQKRCAEALVLASSVGTGSEEKFGLDFSFPCANGEV